MIRPAIRSLPRRAKEMIHRERSHSPKTLIAKVHFVAARGTTPQLRCCDVRPNQALLKEICIRAVGAIRRFTTFNPRFADRDARATFVRRYPVIVVAGIKMKRQTKL